MKAYYVLIAIFIVVSAHSQPSKTGAIIESKDLQHIRVPVNQLKEVRMSDVISESKAIILEFTKQSMVQFTLQFRIVDKHIYVMDSFGMKTLLVFDMEGNYIRSIGSSGRGPGQIPYPKDFIVDSKNQEISIIGNSIFNKFSMDGKFKEGLKFDFSSSQFERVGDHFFFSAPTMEDCLLYKTDINLKKIDALLENRPKSYQGDAFIPFTKKTSSEYFYWTMMNDTIYAISDNKIYPSRFIDFGKYKSKYDEYIELSPGRRMNFLMYKDFYDQCLMNRFFETKDYLYIGYYLNKKYHAYILNKNSHDFLHYDNEHLNDDISYFDIHGKVPKILGTYNDYFVYVLYPHEYNSAKELGRFLNGFSKFKKSEVETMMYETANPIILLVKYKF